MASPTDLATQMRKMIEHVAHEMEFQRSQHEAAMIETTEEARCLRLRIEMLEEEKLGLLDQLSAQDKQLQEVEEVEKRWKERVSEIDTHYDHARLLLASKRREAERWKAEAHALEEQAGHSAKAVAEKFALAHELGSLRPEVEHLRAQAATHQTVVAEKMSLERQLATLQVELETEKRAAARAQAKETKTAALDGRLEEQVERLKAELARERRERERVERDAKKAPDEWERRKTVVEGKLDAMRDKLRSTKEKLKERDAQLQQAQAERHEALAQLAKTERGERASKQAGPTKRTATQMEAIGTPDGVAGPAAKRNKRASALPGDKSTFSITPFLSRTSLAPESPPREASPEALAAQMSRSPPASQRDGRPAKKARPVKEESDAEGVLGPATSAKVNGKAPAAAARKRAARTTPALEDLAEEENEENAAPALTLAGAPPAKARLPPPVPDLVNFREGGDEPEARKKKRKLLGGAPGKTLFDDDEDAGARAARAAKGFPSWIKGGLGGAKGAVKVPVGGGAGFGTFSPLKKDRKASTGP
ncbi:MAG: hypothetical protein M1832_004415 [Thelocarpon impressellum]|nr:MAG: hypothetical protein M1832_004415 [Thelocarpon impressellum]